MSNMIDYDLDVLASNPTEMNQIAERLKQPSTELVNWFAEECGKPPSKKIAANLRKLVRFKEVGRLGYTHDELNRARRFNNFQKVHCMGIVDSHLYEISEEFPSATFLLVLRDPQFSYSGKRVIRAGKLIQEVSDLNHYAQGVDWVSLDIFAPFRAEHTRGEFAHEYGHEPPKFGSLWNQWVDDLIAAAQSLKEINAAEQQEGSL